MTKSRQRFPNAEVIPRCSSLMCMTNLIVFYITINFNAQFNLTLRIVSCFGSILLTHILKIRFRSEIITTKWLLQVKV